MTRLQFITIRDPASGAEASIVPELGSNCFRFRTPRDDYDVDLFWSHPEFLDGTQRPTGSGIPILFPFPGRIRGKVFRWQGKEYPLDSFDRLGNAIHGFVHRRPWKVIEQSENRLTTQFHALRDDPDLLLRWPTDFRITSQFVVEGLRLTIRYVIENPSDCDLPYGLGIHPYFRLPIVPTHRPEDCRIQVPVDRRWDLDGMIPTGQSHQLTNTDEFRSGLRFADMQFDDVFSIAKSDGTSLVNAHIVDGATTVSLRFSPSFPICVLFTPPHREAVCIEPYTCLPNAAELQSQGIDAGWSVLKPAESVCYETEYSVE